MPKFRRKTLKFVTERVKITKRGKILRRVAGQGHNKAKVSGHVTRKRRKRLESGEHPNIRRAVRRMYQVR